MLNAMTKDSAVDTSPETAKDTGKGDAAPEVNRYGTMNLYNKKLRVNIESRFTLFRMPHLNSMTDSSISMNILSSESSRVLSSHTASIIRTGITLGVETLDPSYGYSVRFAVPQQLAENGVRFLCHVAAETTLHNYVGRTQHPHYSHLFYATGFTVDNDSYPPSLVLRDRSDSGLGDRVQLRFAMIYNPYLVRKPTSQISPNVVVYHGEHIVTLTVEASRTENKTDLCLF